MLLDREELRKVRLQAMVQGNTLAVELATALLDFELRWRERLRLKLALERKAALHWLSKCA
jgi:hypothetical protein